MQWEIVVGLETHVQLLTRSKIFSGASTAFGAAPNTQACAVDIALPGVLPVLNKAAVEKAIMFGLAVDAKINRRSVFARKNYFYPDLPKGYQISQYEIPIVQGGHLRIVVGDAEKTVRLTRAHLEEDAGKSLHENFQDSTGIDLNRAGTPLLEIVSEPDMRSAAEAVAYAKALHSLVRWIDICDGNMQEGSFRFDANVSVRRLGESLGTRCEIKNLNSFRFLEHAIEFEARRQIGILEDGGVIEQETRLYDPDKDETRSMRTKEEAHDYRYFPDPDLLPLDVTQTWIDEVKEVLTELPQARRERYQREYGLSAYDTSLLTDSQRKADFFEFAVKLLSGPSAKTVANWVNGELSAILNDRGIDFPQLPLEPIKFADFMKLVVDGVISGKAAKEVLRRMTDGEGDAERIVERHGLTQISDVGEIEKKVDEVLTANPKQVEDYRAGKEKAFNSLVGQVMKATKGKANPQQLTEILKRKLAI
ncbi:MAG TPA: Asp-tRNA(Asn)/Glu-tRNA(Gln) amidotransferase subunit GatB [Burkholderiales bacterium]|nr:Asp-tRNA(Asn)/Glu-tRNA(Gln) amidotransferase subunit GatB [Burkholderiales bacterium]